MTVEVPFTTTLLVRDACLCLHVQRAARTLARRFDEALRPLDLTNGQFSLMMSLNRPQPAEMGGVASLLGMDRTTLTAALKALERRGMVEVHADPRDRRGRLLLLTGPGRSLLAQAVPVWERTHATAEAFLEDGAPDRLRRDLNALSSPRIVEPGDRMSDQFSLPGFEPAAPVRKPVRPQEPKKTDRLFFALFPSPDVAARTAKLAQTLRGQEGLSGRPLATDRFHITLNHLGDYVGLPEEVVARAREAGASVAAAPFELTFDRAASFGRKAGAKPFVLLGTDGLDALMAFQRGLGQAMARAGLGPWVEKNFTPHMTLLYDDKAVAKQAVEPVGWTAHEFVLVHSLLGQTRHIPLARWPLRA